jgi:hypothetical protein
LALCRSRFRCFDCGKFADWGVVVAKLTLPRITITCPLCGIETPTILTGLESAIYFVCECGRIVAHVIIRESETR